MPVTTHHPVCVPVPTIMKRIVLTLLCGALLIGCTVNSPNQKKAKYQIGWYFETDQSSISGPVKSRYSDKLHYVDQEPIVIAYDFKRIDIVKQNWGGNEFSILEIVFEGEAKEKWADATERMSRTMENAVFIYDDQVIATVSTFRKIDNGYASVSNENLTEEALNMIVKDIKKNK